jgi:hypothetical protein
MDYFAGLDLSVKETSVCMWTTRARSFGKCDAQAARAELLMAYPAGKRARSRAGPSI